MKQAEKANTVIHFTQVDHPPPLMGGGQGEGEVANGIPCGTFTPTLALPHQGGGDALVSEVLPEVLYWSEVDNQKS